MVKDIENAADAKKPGDKKEDMKTSKLPFAKKAAAAIVARKLKKPLPFK